MQESSQHFPKRLVTGLTSGALLLALCGPAAAQISTSGGLSLPLPASAKAALTASPSIPLRVDLSIVSRGSGAAGVVVATQKIASVSPKTVKLIYSATHADGRSTETRRSVRREDLKQATSYRPNFVDGADEFFEGTTAFGTSTRVLADLKQAGRSPLTMDAGGISMNAGVQGAGLARELDGMLGDMGGFAGIAEALERQAASGSISEQERAEGAAAIGDIDALQMLSGTLRFLRREPVEIEVNGRTVALPGIVAIGDMKKDLESYEVELVFLDDPSNPLTLRSRVGNDTHQVISIRYPQ